MESNFKKLFSFSVLESTFFHFLEKSTCLVSALITRAYLLLNSQFELLSIEISIGFAIDFSFLFTFLCAKSCW